MFEIILVQEIVNEGIFEEDEMESIKYVRDPFYFCESDDECKQIGEISICSILLVEWIVENRMEIISFAT